MNLLKKIESNKIDTNLLNEYKNIFNGFYNKLYDNKIFELVKKYIDTCLEKEDNSYDDEQIELLKKISNKISTLKRKENVKEINLEPFVFNIDKEKNEGKVSILNINIILKRFFLYGVETIDNDLIEQIVNIIIFQNIKMLITDLLFDEKKNGELNNFYDEIAKIYDLFFISEIILQDAWGFLTEEQKENYAIGEQTNWKYFKFWELPFSGQPVLDNNEMLGSGGIIAYTDTFDPTIYKELQFRSFEFLSKLEDIWKLTD